MGGVKEVEQPLTPGPVGAAGTVIIPEEEQGEEHAQVFHPQQVVRRAGQASQIEQIIGRTGEQADGIDGKQDDQCVAEGLIAEVAVIEVQHDDDAEAPDAPVAGDAQAGQQEEQDGPEGCGPGAAAHPDGQYPQEDGVDNIQPQGGHLLRLTHGAEIEEGEVTDAGKDRQPGQIAPDAPGVVKALDSHIEHDGAGELAGGVHDGPQGRPIGDKGEGDVVDHHSGNGDELEGEGGQPHGVSPPSGP